MRRCNRCGVEKPFSDFAWHRRAKGQGQHHCRNCHAAYRRDHYLENRERYIQRAALRKRELHLERTKLLIEYFSEHPCTDCGETDPVVLEFDHLRDKEFEVGPKLATYPWKVVLAEIEKCEVVCGNCHKRRTARRRQSSRARLAGLEPERTDKGPGEPGPPPCL